MLSGEISLKDYVRQDKKTKTIQEILNGILTKQELEIKKLVVKSIANELNFMDCMILFGGKNYTETKRELENLLKSLNGRIDNSKGSSFSIARTKVNVEFRSYAKPFNEREYIGLEKQFGNSEPITITEEHVEAAQKYLKLNHEYICNKTMSETINKILKGEISLDDINKKYELREMDRKEAYLAELTKKEQNLDREIAESSTVKRPRKVKSNYIKLKYNKGETKRMDKSMITTRGIIYKIKLFFSKFKKNISKNEIIIEENETIKENNFKNDILVEKDCEKERLLRLQRMYRNKQIKGEELSYEDIKRLNHLYDEQILEAEERIKQKRKIKKA